MKLYYNPASPFVRKALVFLHELGLAGEVEIVEVIGSPVDPGTLPVTENPLGKIPTLVTDDGASLYDSRVICRYLDNLAGGRLYPEGGGLWRTLTLEATADGIMEAAVLVVYETRCREEPQRSTRWVEGQWSKVARSLDLIEAEWIEHLDGGFDAGQAAVGCALGYLDLRHPGRHWRDRHGRLAGWFSKVSERTSMAATIPWIPS